MISNPKIIVVQAGGEYADAVEFDTLADAKAEADRRASATKAEVYVLVPKLKYVPTTVVTATRINEE